MEKQGLRLRGLINWRVPHRDAWAHRSMLGQAIDDAFALRSSGRAYYAGDFPPGIVAYPARYEEPGALIDIKSPDKEGATVESESGW